MSKKHSLTAIIYNKRGKEIAIGQNSYTKTHPLQAKAAAAVGKPHLIYLHAEVAALVRLRDWKSAYRMAIFRYNSNGLPVCAKPCISCQQIIKQAGIKYVEYT